ncbi:triose-phosphate isomerase [Gallaecimonas sp. GXIMD1310]|uniref:triose-phosphate isomerase n=1 Tax=Gallaecimonas sp. GXIMD1310 TaxID=3131926 RepID=UPI0032511BE9
MRRPLVMGNWKLNGSLAMVRQLLADLQAPAAQAEAVKVAVCPPFVYLPEAARLLADSVIALGAQDCSSHANGAFTGEVAANMLAEHAVSYVLVGHSERRALHGETDAIVASKFQAAQAAGLTPVLCVGETLNERQQGLTEQVIGQQLQAVLQHTDTAALGNAVIAYEPVWAIGTGQAAAPEDAQAVHQFIRQQLASASSANVAEQLAILYGGSVNAQNAAALFAMADIDGALVGGAALDASAFAGIINAAQQAG